MRVAGSAGAMGAGGTVAWRDQDLGSGPAKLCEAFGIARAQNGADLVGGDAGLWIADDGVDPPSSPGVGRRVGIRMAAEHRWRWWVPGDPNVSRPVPAAPWYRRRALPEVAL